jgi:hypothetical protein
LDDSSFAVYRPHFGGGGALNPLFATRLATSATPPKINAEVGSTPSPQSDPVLSQCSLPADVARNLAENQRMYREAKTSSLPSESPVADSKTAAPLSTPATLAKPPVHAAAETVPDFLKNTDLHGLEPALSVRTRILLACHAMNRMNMSLDIAKSFAIAGYFPRVRCVPSCVCDFINSIHHSRPAKLRAFQDELAAKNGELQPGERRVSGRRRDDQVKARATCVFRPF